MVLPSPADRLVAQAADQPPEAAEATLREALELEPRHAKALLALARVSSPRATTSPRPCGCSSWWLRPSPAVADAERLAAALRTRSDGAGDEAALRARITADPGDLEARLALGRTLAAQDRHEDALGELLAVVQRDRHFDDDAARKTMVDLFAVLGSDHPLTERFRGELAKALF